MSGKGRVFTEQELEDMGTPTAQLICAAADANDKQKVKELTRRMEREATGNNDSYVKWVTSLMSFIGKRYGDEVLEEALRESCGDLIRDGIKVFQKWEKEGNDRRRAEAVALITRSHNCPMTVEEDDEKFTFTMQPCGTGGKAIQEGLYGPPCDYYKIKKAQPMTSGIEDFPVYCAHGPIFNMLQLELTGGIQFYEEPSDELGVKPCKVYLFKDSSRIPPELRAKASRIKPSLRA